MDRYVFAITWPRAWKIYWAHYWRMIVAGVTLGIPAGVLAILLAAVIRVTRPAILFAGVWMLVAAVVMLVGAWSMKRALQVRYAEFAIDVAAVDPAAAAGVPTTATLSERHGLAVFWAMFWRGWLIFFPVNMLASIVFTGSVLPTASSDWTTASLVLMLVQMVVTAAASTWALRIALKLDYANWRLQLVPN